MSPSLTGAGAGSHVGRHRRDVQGLRGVAILLVVVFHTGIGLQGGFLGVDVFLVISGFVIGQRLLEERLRDDMVRLGDFFARRIRRLLPAMAVFSVTTAVLSVLLLSPFGDQQRVLWTGMSATVFLANVELYRTTGYFDGSADRNPYLHTWSLSLEEQFYMLLPIVLMFAWWVAPRLRRGSGSGCPDRGAANRRRRTLRAAFAAVSAMGVVSLILSLVLTSGAFNPGLQAPQRLVFFSMPTRVWQFSAGVLLAVMGSTATPATPAASGATAALGISGLVALGAASVGLDPLAAQPNGWTLLAVGGTVALLAVGTSGAPTTRLLSSAPLVWLGDRSYGWYLWHWPAIVFAVVLWPGRPYVPVLAAAGSLAPTELSYRFVERPFRFGAQWVGARAAGLAAVCILVPLVILGSLRSGAQRHWGMSEPSEWYDLSPTYGTDCHLINRDAANSFDLGRCSFGPGPPEATGTVLLLGDELANAVGPGVVEAATRRGWRTVQWSREGCPMVLGEPGPHYPACARWQKDAFDLVDDLRPDAVVLANQSLDPAQRAGLPATLEALDDRGTQTVLVAPIVDFGEVFPRRRLSLLNPRPEVPALSRKQAESRRSAVADLLARLAAHRWNVDLVDPLDHLCDTRCRPVRNGRWLYLGPRALTAEAARELSPEFAEALRGP